MSIVFTESGLWLIVCVLAGALYAYVLYNRQGSIFKPLMRRALALLRFAVVTLLCILLMAPLIRKITNRYEKPVVVLAIDNSRSMTASADSVWVKNQIPDVFSRLKASLSKDFRVESLRFGDQPSDSLLYTFSDEATDFSLLFANLSERYSGQKVSALVLASDGIINRGVNPVSTTSGKLLPVFALACGDTLPRRDLALRKINYNRVTFLGNVFPVEIIVKADACRGARSRISLREGGKIRWQQDFEVISDNQALVFSPEIEATRAGLIRFTVTIEPFDGEMNTSNNTGDFFVEVKDSRVRILILANAPHPDIAALRGVFASRSIYQNEFFLFPDFKGDIAAYDLIVLHQIPSVRFPAGDLIAQAKRAGKPLLYILGEATDIERFNALQAGLSIGGNRGNLIDAYPELNPGFFLFKTSPRLAGSLKKLPPLICPGGVYKTSPAASVYMGQVVADVSTGFPLILFQIGTENRIGVICGEGIWWWRNKLYQMHAGHEAFDDLAATMVQYLTLQEETGSFRVKSATRFNAGDHIEFDAELYNPAFELVNEPEVRMEISDETGVRYPFVFSRSAGAYYLDAGLFGPGIYNWVASVRHNNQDFTRQGSFVVDPLLVEMNYLTANHRLLYNLAETSGGRLVYPHETDSIAPWIDQLNNRQTIVYTDEDFAEPVSFWMLMALLMALAISEWALRKWSGVL